MVPVDSRVWYALLINVIAVARLLEIARSMRNARRLRARGGVESGAGHYPAMVMVHAGVIVAAPLEVFLADRPFLPPLGVAMAVLLAGTMALRYWVMAVLGERWCTRVIVPPDDPLVTTGPFRVMRHPNYLAVALEVPALALLHTAWLSALVFGALNLLVLAVRIRVEDEALGRRPVAAATAASATKAPR